MKKITLLLIAACSTFIYAQENRGTDMPKSTVPSGNTVTIKLPTEATLTSKNYYDQVASLNPFGTTIYNQADPGSSDVISQQFESTNSTKTTNVADDFTVPVGKRWSIESVSAVGTLVGSIQPTIFNVTFYTNSGTNLPETVVHTETVVLSAGSTNPTLPLAAPLLFSSGTYWVSIQAVLNSTTQGSWFWKIYNAFDNYGSPFAVKNPGNGYGFPCLVNWATYATCTGTKYKDLQFKLTGTESGLPCKSFTGRLTTADPTQMGRVSRLNPPSVCGNVKAFPGILSATSQFHYKTYSVKNTSATADCVTFNLTNADPLNQLFLIAYNGSYNPADLSQNYMGDTASSTANNPSTPPVSMGITIPAGATVVLVVAEGTAAVYPFSGDYTLEVVSANCGGILKTGETGGKNINIYPNPVSTILFVNGMKMTDAKVYDTSGKLVPVKSTESQINVQALPKGNYLLQVKDKSGNVHQDKFIKN